MTMYSENKNIAPSDEVLRDSLFSEFVSGVLKEFGDTDPGNNRALVASVICPDGSIKGMGETDISVYAAATDEGVEYSLTVSEPDKAGTCQIFRYATTEGFSATTGKGNLTHPITYTYEGLRDLLTDLQKPINDGTAISVQDVAA